jgi:hypothetical protein
MLCKSAIYFMLPVIRCRTELSLPHALDQGGDERHIHEGAERPRIAMRRLTLGRYGLTHSRPSASMKRSASFGPQLPAG